MKILQIIDILNVGGAERVFVDMCNILFENKQDVTSLLLLDNSGKLTSELLSPIIQLKRRNKWSLPSMYRCSKIINNYDIIHCHNKHVFRYIKLVSLIFRINKNILLQDHSSFMEFGNQLYTLKYILKPKYYIGVSNVINNYAKNSIGLESKCIFLLENIVRKSITSKKIDNTDFIIVSNIKRSKNILFSLKLLENFSKKTLLLLGNIQEEEYYRELQTYAEKNKLEIIFISNLIQVQSILKNTKIGLHTSKSETGPLVLIEYLAQGLPFLAYETGEVAKILKPHFPDYFIDNFDLQEWKIRIEKINNSEPDLLKMNEIFEFYFGEKQYYEKLQKIYQCINDY